MSFANIVNNTNEIQNFELKLRTKQCENKNQKKANVNRIFGIALIEFFSNLSKVFPSQKDVK